MTFEVALFASDSHIEFRYMNVVAGNGSAPFYLDNGMSSTIGIRSGFPNLTAGNLFASGSVGLPVGVSGLQIGYNGGPQHVAVVQNGTDIVFTPNQPPSAIALTSTSVLDGQPSGTVVGTLASTDSNPGDSFTYSLVSGLVPNDNADFAIVGNQLVTSTPLPYQANNQFTVLVQTQDLRRGDFPATVYHHCQPYESAAGRAHGPAV